MRLLTAGDNLLLIIDGYHFQIDATNEEEYQEELVRKLSFSKAIREVFRKLNEMTMIPGFQQFPPICIMISNAELINPGYRNAIEGALQTVFCHIFENTPFAIMTATSMGNSDSRFEPWCIEELMAFVGLTMLLKYKEIIVSNTVVREDMYRLLATFNSSKAVYVYGKKYALHSYVQQNWFR